jgi:regulator of sigma E protease
MTITAIITFIIILFVLVTVHELGHFLFAKLTGMRVDEFAFGFPPRLFSKKIGETLYSFNMIPLGGYVKIFGENGEQTPSPLRGASPKEAEAQKADLGVLPFGKVADRPEGVAFSSKSPFARIFVLLGGVLFNVIAAILIFSLSFMGSGYRNITNDEALNIPFSERKIIVASVDDKSSFHNNPFFLTGTEILSVGTKDKTIPTEQLTSKNIGQFVQENNNSIIRVEYKTTIEGESIEKVVEAVPQPGIVEGKKILGLGFADISNTKYTIFQALKAGTEFTFSTLENIFVEIWKLIINLFTGKAQIKDSLSGPVGLAVLTNKIASEGLTKVLFFAGMLSLSLAAFNILPIPALDGGRILFVLFEIIFRRKIPVKVEQTFHALGFFLLILLMLFVTYFDILKLI